MARLRAVLWVLRNADIVLTFFNGGFLQNTPYRWLELTILKLAGKAVVVSPYGRTSRFAVTSRAGSRR